MAPVKCIQTHPLPVASAVVRSVAAGLLFIVASIACVGSIFGPCFVMQYYVSFLVFQSS